MFLLLTLYSSSNLSYDGEEGYDWSLSSGAKLCITAVMDQCCTAAHMQINHAVCMASFIY